jgi:hypothetical protein
MLTFDNALTVGFSVSGTAQMQELSGPGGSFPSVVTTPPTSIQLDQNSRLEFTWTQVGILSTMLTGIWRCDVFLEQMGPGEGPACAGVTTPFVPTSGHTYNVFCNIPAGSVPIGLYRVTARLMLLPNSSGGNPNALSPIAAFEDLGLVQYHNA